MSPTWPAAAHVRAVSASASHEKSPICASSNVPPGTGSRISSADAANIVAAHNAARREAIQRYNPGLPLVSLTWNPKLACDAQAWADDPESSKNNMGNHSSRVNNGNEGENIYRGAPVPARPMTAMDSWMAEKPKFDADNNSLIQEKPPDGTNYLAWGHYSQIVWMSPASSTTAVGCGVKEGVLVSGNTGWIMVCRYTAAGNIAGERAIPSGGGPVAPPADIAGEPAQPATLVWPNQQHVFYRSANGAIKHRFWDATRSQVFADDWTEKAH
ncbi:CAP domain-containing protein, partial [Embleya hyalina]|uniref:CAP domain-containing protein n=1 Tax=Embleya hyalina TaxID=516124 RepID=UPI002482CE7A